MPHPVTEPPARSGTGRTAWSWGRDTPLRAFVRTETGSAVLLLGLTVAALVWVALSPGSYERVWTASLSLRLGGVGIGQDLRGWVDNGLMTFFFLVIGLEARRSLDIGDLRERSRVLLPLLAGIGGMVTSVGLYLVLTHGGPGAQGWGIAMSTDTAFSLGLLALARAEPLAALRGFMLTVVVVDDILALVVIAVFYSDRVRLLPLVVAVAVYGLVLLALRLRVRAGGPYVIGGVVVWLGLYASGLDPLVVGLAMGLLSYASPVGRDALESATSQFREFREQPTSELARATQLRVRAALPPNERLQALVHPWTSFLIVPLFALANAGIPVTGASLGRAVTSPVAVGVVVAYVVGKPVGIGLVSWVTATASRGRYRPPVGWGAVLGGGASAGVGFTVSLLIATLAFDGPDLEAAKIGILAAATLSAALTWGVFRALKLLPRRLRARALFGTLVPLTDLTEPVDPERDHVRGSTDAPVTLLEYGDLECPYCGQAEPAVRTLLADSADVRYVWRHLPLTDVHPHAQLAAEATEAAGRQDRFWEMHDLLLAHQDALEARHLLGYAEQLGLDVEQFRDDLHRHSSRTRIAGDVESAAASGVVGTPTFFVDGRRYHGSYDVAALLAAVQDARARALAP